MIIVANLVLNSEMSFSNIADTFAIGEVFLHLIFHRTNQVNMDHRSETGNQNLNSLSKQQYSTQYVNCPNFSREILRKT